MLRSGIEAAREGNRSEAKHFLLRVTEAEPNCEEGWLWLASISEYPEELLIYLNNVLSINPENQAALERSKATKSMLAKTFVERGIDALNQNNAHFAKQCFLQALVQDGESETAWLNIVSVADSNEEKISYLKKVLSINPGNEDAHNLLISAKNDIAETLLRKANQAAAAGDKQNAESLIAEVLENAPENENAWMLKSHLVESLNAKISCYQNVLNINPENQAAKSGLMSLQAIMSQFEEESAAAQEVSNDETVQADDYQSESEIPEPYEEEEEDIDLELSLDEYENESVQTVLEESSFEPKSEAENAGQYDVNEFSVDENANNFEEQPLQIQQPEYSPENVENFEMPSYYEESAYEESSQEAAENNDSQEEYSASEYQNSSAPEYTEETSANEYTEETSAYSSEYVEAVSENDYSQEYAAAEYEQEAEAVSNESQAADFQMQSAEAVSPEEYEPNLSQNVETAENSFDVADEVSEVSSCPFCDEQNDLQAFKCGSCKAVLTLTDLEMLISHQEAVQEVLGKRMQDLEFEKSVRGFDAEELKVLAIGQINLRNLRKGYSYLQDAVKLAPNDVVLRSQVNAMAIRLAEIEEQESIHSSMPRGKVILVVDDSATVRKLISSKLLKSGHEVICAVDGVDALEKIKEVSPDLVLLDITMPRMDGYQVCKVMRSEEITKEVPIVMISGNDGFFDKVRGRMAGTTGYITKPFGPETLMKTVETYLAGTYD